VFVVLALATALNPSAKAQLSYPEDASIAKKFALYHHHNNQIVNKFITELVKINDLKALSKNPLANLTQSLRPRLESFDPDKEELGSRCPVSSQADFNLSPLCLYYLLNSEYEHLLTQLPSEPTQQESEFIKQEKELVYQQNFHTAMYYGEFFTALPIVQELTLLENQLQKIRSKLHTYRTNILKLKIKLPNATSTQCK